LTAIASKSQLRMSLLRHALVTVPLILLLGTLSGRIANSGYGNIWFDALKKPDLMPAGAVFGIVWTILYILLGLSLAMILHARGARGRAVAIAFFAAQMVLNFSWSPVFFALHQTKTALVIIVAMIVLTVVTAYLFAKIRKAAALLLLPYLAWLCFAALLNYEIVRLNPHAENLVPADGSADIAL
jgi:benzodiazapine receptor